MNMPDKKEGAKIQYLQAYFIRNMMKFCNLKQNMIPIYISTKMDEDKNSMVEFCKQQLQEAVKNKNGNKDGVKDKQLTQIFENLKKTSKYPKVNRLLRELKSILTKNTLKELKLEDLNSFINILGDCNKKEMETGFSETKIKNYLRIKGENQELIPEAVEDITRYYIVPNLMEQKNQITSIFETCICDTWICTDPRTKKRFITLDEEIKNRLNSIKNDYKNGDDNKENLIKYISNVLLVLLDIRMSYDETDIIKISRDETRYTEEVDWYKIIENYTETYTEGTMMVTSDKLKTLFMNLAFETTEDYYYIRKFHSTSDDAKFHTNFLLHYRLGHYLNVVQDSDYAKSETKKWYRKIIEENRIDINPRAILKSPVYVGNQVTIDAKCMIEAYCYIGDKVRIYGDYFGKVTIHEHVIIEEGCTIFGPCDIKEYTIIENGTTVCGNVGGNAIINSDKQMKITREQYADRLNKKYRRD